MVEKFSHIYSHMFYEVKFRQSTYTVLGLVFLYIEAIVQNKRLSTAKSNSEEGK